MQPTDTGLTDDLEARLKSNSQGNNPHTSKYRPWRIEAAIAFRSRKKAAAFEKYLKSHSGRAFASEHLYNPAKTGNGWIGSESFDNAEDSFLPYILLHIKGSYRASRRHYKRNRQSDETLERASFKSRSTIWKRFPISSGVVAWGRTQPLSTIVLRSSSSPMIKKAWDLLELEKENLPLKRLVRLRRIQILRHKAGG